MSFETKTPSPKFVSLTGTRKRKMFATKLSDNNPRGMRTASYWDGGSKRSYSVLNLASGETNIPPAGSYPSFCDGVYTLKPGEILIETGVYCGKPATPSLTYFPADEAKAKEFFN